MKNPSRIFRLEADSTGRVMRFVCGLDGLTFSEGDTRREVTITRTGSFTDPRYGRFEITRDMLLSMVRNFDARTYGQDIFIDVAHVPANGAAARILSLKLDGNRLRAVCEFTPFGVAAVKQRGFRYLSAEFSDDYVDNEGGKAHGPTLLGAGLTVRPVIKRLDPVELSESSEHIPVFLHPELVRQLSESLEQITMNWLEKLKERLRKRKLSEAAIAAIVASYETAAKNLGEDAKAHETLIDQLDEAAKQLSESGAGGGAPINITIAAPTPAKTDGDDAGKTLSADDVRKILSEAEAARTADAKKLSDAKETRVKIFTDAIDGAKGLSEPTRVELKKASDLITGEMSDDQVKRFAENQLALGNQLEASRQLSTQGFHRAGTAHITLDETNAIKQLSETVRTGLKKTSFAMTGRLRLAEPAKLNPFVTRLLEEFDREHGHQLHEEAKQLSGGVVTTSDMKMPASYQREVITELYQDLNILQLVSATVDITTAATHNIPFETRDVSGVVNEAITYEGQPIQQAGIKQDMTLAYVNQRKLALELTNEAIWFSRNNPTINWDAWARNIASNSQLMRELVARAIANRMQRDSDSYGAITVAPAATSAYSGATNGYKVANFPVVRPYQARDLQGNAIGSVENAVIVKDGATVLNEFDGSGTQGAGEVLPRAELQPRAVPDRRPDRRADRAGRCGDHRLRLRNQHYQGRHGRACWQHL